MDAKQEHNLMNKFKKYIKNIKKGHIYLQNMTNLIEIQEKKECKRGTTFSKL